MNRAVVDATGQVFGRLTVQSLSDKRAGRAAVWVCKCRCGNIVEVPGYTLREGKTQSCGCLRDERARETMTTHGLSYQRLYAIRHGMMVRCYNQNDPSYRRYGGRGITICDEWRNDAQAFYDWAVTHGYKSNLTIERNDNDGNYEPSNCSWIPKGDQAKNPKTRKAVSFGLLRHYAIYGFDESKYVRDHGEFSGKERPTNAAS